MRLLFAALLALTAVQVCADDDPVDLAVAELRRSGIDPDLDNMIRPGRERAKAAGVDADRLKTIFQSMPKEPPVWIGTLHEYSPEQSREFLDLAEQTQADRQYLETLIADGAVFPIDWRLDSPLATLLPHLSPARRLAQVAAGDFRLRAAAGDAKGAMREWRFMDELTDRIYREPLLISHLVAMALDGIRLRTLDVVVETGALTALSDAELREILDALRDETKLRASFKQALNGELIGLLNETANADLSFAEALLRYELSSPSFGEPEDPEAIRRMLELLTSEQGRRDLADVIRHIHRHIARGDRDYSEFKNDGDLEAPDTPGWWQLAGSYDSSVLALNRTLAQYRIHATGLALELYRRQYGRLPETLAQLVPEFLPAAPRDPFDGAELRYFAGDFPVPWQSADGESVRTLHGAKVYSIGPDLADDGGLRGGHMKLDTVFFLATPGD